MHFPGMKVILKNDWSNHFCMDSESKRDEKNNSELNAVLYERIKGFYKIPCSACAVDLLTVRCGALGVVPFSENTLIKSDVSCSACRLYSALKWQNMTCRQSTRASGLLLNAIFALIIIVWCGTDQLQWKSNLVPISLNGNSIMSSLFLGELISSWEISPYVICTWLPIIHNQMGCNACKSLSIYLLFNPF